MEILRRRDGDDHEAQTRADAHDDAHGDEQTADVARREAAEDLAQREEAHAQQSGVPRAQQSDDARVDEGESRDAGGGEGADEGECGRGRQLLRDQGRLDDAPAVARADEPEGQHAAAEQHRPAVAAIWDGGVRDLGDEEDVVGVWRGGCGGGISPWACGVVPAVGLERDGGGLGGGGHCSLLLLRDGNASWPPRNGRDVDIVKPFEECQHWG